MPNRTKDDLWERQPGESAQAYEAFAIYRDMGSNRSLRVVAEQLSKSDTLIKDIIQFLDKATELERDNRMEEAGVTAGGKTAEEQEETTLSLADEIAAAYENRKRGEQT